MTATYGTREGATAAQRELDRLDQRHKDIHKSAPNYPHEPKPYEPDHGNVVIDPSTSGKWSPCSYN
ncbi:hypothetical protein [Streptomyces sp. gCLA4]|uniref:hypothetical protein n=1 Tax=Streptomyces sp. gCLA4 TaxID=1873416 RepID=UPI001600EF0E|nr:hypothetical protein [Streptomyces sp. gCLA4]